MIFDCVLVHLNKVRVEDVNTIYFIDIVPFEEIVVPKLLFNLAGLLGFKANFVEMFAIFFERADAVFVVFA